MRTARASNLGIRCSTSRSARVRGVRAQPAGPFEGRAEDTTEENLQARIAGRSHALSKQVREIVLTRDKSEMSVGYATLYGDMAGGFAVIKDVFKTMVYRVSRRYNESRGRDMIPARVLTKASLGGASPGQKDSDSLPSTTSSIRS